MLGWGAYFGIPLPHEETLVREGAGHVPRADAPQSPGLASGPSEARCPYTVQPSAPPSCCLVWEQQVRDMSLGSWVS